MLVYLFGFCMTMLFSYFYVTKYNTNKKTKIFSNYNFKKTMCFLLAIFPLWFITAFRYDVGTDYFYTYVKYFEHTSLGYKPYAHEPLFQLLNTALVTLRLNYVWLFAISGTIIIGLLFYYIFRFSPMPLFSITIFFCSSFFFNSLNNVRQYIAIAIAILGFSQKHFWRATMIIVIAALFHLTALVYVPLYILMNILLKRRVSKNKMLLWSVLSVLLAPILCILFKKIVGLTQYAYFLETENSGFSLLIIIVNLFIFIFTLFYYDSRDKNYQRFALLQLLTTFCCVCSIFLKNEEMWMRIIRITSTFQIILLPMIVLREKNHLFRLVLGISFIFIYSAYTIYTVYYRGGLEVFPYQFIFGNL